MAKTRFQIRDETFGLALYEAENARDALLDFVADHAKGEARPNVVAREDGSAELVFAGVRYLAVPAAEVDDESATGPPTEEELEEARKRLQPYLNGYPEPMIDSRRWRIANERGTAKERREIAAEDEVVRRIRRG